MKIIGLTGPTGSGKSTVSRQAGALGFTVLDCDVIAHGVTGKDVDAIAALKKEFGNITAPDGSIDRKKLAAKAFSSDEATEKLNRTVLPLYRESSGARDRCRKKCRREGSAARRTDPL